MRPAPESLRVSDAAREAPGAPALVLGGQRLDFADLAGRADHARARLDRARGDPVGPIALTARPSLPALVLTYAALEAGRPLVLFHPRWSATEREEAVARSDRELSLSDDEVDLLAGGPAADPPSWSPRHAARPEGPGSHASPDAVRLFTSGTSGKPRAVRLGADALVASARAHAAALPFEAEDVWLLALPFSHVGGLSILTRCLIARRPVVVLERFDPDVVIHAIERERVSLLSVVPPMLDVLLEHPKAAVLSRLRAVLVGGAAFSSELRARAQDRGVNALATYGLTEASSQVTTQRLGSFRDPSSRDSGAPLEGVELEIRDARGAVLGARENGRLFVRSRSHMRGYVGEPEIAPGAWLETGDLGRIEPGGELVVLGRADDTIVTGGENVEPLEVELALSATGQVGGAIVFGVPDAKWGALVAAVLVLSDGASLMSVFESLDPSIASFKRPRLVATAAALPTTPSGKPDRAAARRLFQQSLSVAPPRR